jgi:hypothetical protein
MTTNRFNLLRHVKLSVNVHSCGFGLDVHPSLEVENCAMAVETCVGTTAEASKVNARTTAEPGHN